MFTAKLKSFLLITFINLFSYIFSKDFNLFGNLKLASREKQAIKVINNAILAGYRLNDTAPIELMSQRKWLEASRLILDFLSDFNDNKQLAVIKNNNEDYLSYLKNIKNSLKDKKKNIAKISPVFEWSQDNYNVKIRVKFAKNLEAPGEIDIQDFFINVTRTHFFISGYKPHEDYLVWYCRQIDLQANIKAAETSGYKETEGAYVITLKKEIATLYWFQLDMEHQSHHNMFTWFEVFTNYEDKARFTSWRDNTKDNLMESDIEDYKREKKEYQIKRLKKIAKNFKFFKTVYAQNKNFCLSPVDGKYCSIPKPTDWTYWQV